MSTDCCSVLSTMLAPRNRFKMKKRRCSCLQGACQLKRPYDTISPNCFVSMRATGVSRSQQGKGLDGEEKSLLIGAGGGGGEAH